MKVLTEQAKLYAQNRLKGIPKKESAILAGCPEKTASQAASRYEKHPLVIEYMERHKSEKSPPPKKAVSTQQAPVKDAGTSAEPSQPHAPETGSTVVVEFIEADPEWEDDPIQFFKNTMNDRDAYLGARLDAAKALAAYTIPKPGDKGKKEEKAEAAKKAGNGKFGSAKPPAHLRSVK